MAKGNFLAVCLVLVLTGPFPAVFVTGFLLVDVFLDVFAAKLVAPLLAAESDGLIACILLALGFDSLL